MNLCGWRMSSCASLRAPHLAMPVKRYKRMKGPALVFVTTTVNDWIPVFSLRPAAVAVTQQLQETMHYHKVAIVG